MDFQNLQADLETHRIEGYAPTGAFVSVPLISHITDNLYVGGCQDGVDLDDFFSHVFSFYKWEKYATADSTVHKAWEMYDNGTVDMDTLEEVVPEIVKALDEGGNVLVHCQAGINRSNLVAAMVLHDRYSMTMDEAISFLRERRSSIVLMNKNFENFLRRLDGYSNDF